MMRQHHAHLSTIDFPLRMPGGVQIGTRTAIVRLVDGSLLVHSPGPADEATFVEIDASGPVRHIVAPNLFHHFSVKDWSRRYPDAAVHAPPDFESKVQGLSFETLGDEAPAAWANEMDQIAVPGAPRMNEVVFCHRASRTLLLTDLCFNMRQSDSFVTRVFMSLMGGYGHFGPSRLARAMMKDKAAVKAAVERILELDFDRVTVTHGEILESGGREALRAAFSGIG